MRPNAEVFTAPPPAASALPAGNLPGRGGLILFVDDDRSVREMVVPILTEEGYRVLSAGNGAEALELLSLHQGEVCLILTDRVMPVMDGTALLKALDERGADLPVILMSGEVDFGERNLPPAATAFLRKPFRLEKLFAVIDGALQTKEER
jgi:DNA-binding NtrC family response regulator